MNEATTYVFWIIAAIFLVILCHALVAYEDDDDDLPRP